MNKRFDKLNKVTRQTLGRYNTKDIKHIAEERKAFSDDKVKQFKREQIYRPISGNNPFSDASRKKSISKRIDMKELEIEDSRNFDFSTSKMNVNDTEDFDHSFELIEDESMSRASLPKSVVNKKISHKKTFENSI